METSSAPPSQIGNYRILSKIAEGGMGAVWKAEHISTKEVVAVKIVPAETVKNTVLLKRFEQEFHAARLLEHPNVVRAIEFSTAGAHPYLVMEFVDGESLGQRVEREGSIPEGEAIRLISQVCDGLHRAHKQGLIHRDVKPDNILVTRSGVAKLTDMGLVKDVEGELNLTRTGRGLGTPHFMAPEQFRDAKNVDVRGDIYSLGATLYMLVTGTVPFAKTSPLDCWMKKIKNDFPSPRQVNPKLSERVDWAIRRSMSADPERRPSSCREFIEDLLGQPRGTGSDPSTSLQNNGGEPNSGLVDLWYLVYRDTDGQQKTVKGNTESIRQNLKAGALGDPNLIMVGRSKTGNFIPLKSSPEFRDLVIEPAAMNTTSGKSGGVADQARTAGKLPTPTKPSGTSRPPIFPGNERRGNGEGTDPDRTKPYNFEPVVAPGIAPAGSGIRRTPRPGPSAIAKWLPLIVILVSLLIVAGAAFAFFR